MHKGLPWSNMSRRFSEVIMKVMLVDKHSLVRLALLLTLGGGTIGFALYGDEIGKPPWRTSEHYPQLEVRGSASTETLTVVASLEAQKRSPALQAIMKGLRHYPTRVQDVNLANDSSGDVTVAQYNPVKNRIELNRDQMGDGSTNAILQLAVPKFAHEGTHRLLRARGLNNSVLEELFCADLEYRTAREIGSFAQGLYDSDEEMAQEIYRLYGDDLGKHAVIEPRFVETISKLETDGFMPPGAGERARILEKVLQRVAQ